MQSSQVYLQDTAEFVRKAVGGTAVLESTLGNCERKLGSNRALCGTARVQPVQGGFPATNQDDK